jgi:hypothetical protein
MVLVLTPFGIALTPQVASAATRCPQVYNWQDWGGSRVHIKVEFRAADLCNGRHVKRVYVKLWRTCWPAVDTGWIASPTASSPSSTTTLNAYKMVYDSPNWGCNTRSGWDWTYF